MRSKDRIYPDMDPDRTDHSRSVPNTVINKLVLATLISTTVLNILGKLALVGLAYYAALRVVDQPALTTQTPPEHQLAQLVQM